MEKFYFTYGWEGHPFVGGWTEIIAGNRAEACAAFRIFHPDKIEGLLNCCSVYTDAEFKNTRMFALGNNLGACCHEFICLKREVF